jgi:hypothetical protein
MINFDFISGENFRISLENDHQELNKAMGVGMPSRFVCKDGEETSGQREETCKVCPDHLTRQKHAPKLAKVISKRGSEIRARASFHGSCSTGSEAQTSPPEPPSLVGWFLSSGSQHASSITARVCASGCPGWWPRRSSGNWSPW